MSDEERVRGFLTLAAEELAAAERLIEPLPRQAAYFLSQAAEKTARAVLAAEGIPFGTSHNIGQMAAALPAGHPWRPGLMALDRLSPASTRYRYPTAIQPLSAGCPSRRQRPNWLRSPKRWGH